MKEAYVFFVGIDWAWDEHTICVLDSNGEVIDRRAIPHSGAGLALLGDLLKKLSKAKAKVSAPRPAYAPIQPRSVIRARANCGNGVGQHAHSTARRLFGNPRPGLLAVAVALQHLGADGFLDASHRKALSVKPAHVAGCRQRY
jgi:hypothetical protein